MRRTTTVVLLALAALAVSGVGTASAATRLAVATGGVSVGDCTNVPCTLTTALSRTVVGDDVSVAAGSYTSSTTLAGAQGDVYVHGAVGAVPVITLTGSATLVGEPTTGGRLSLSDLDVRSSSNNATVNVEGNVTRLRVDNSSTVGSAVQFSGVDGVLSNSIVRGSGYDLVEASSFGGFGTSVAATIDHVTVWGRGTSTGIVASSSGQTDVMGGAGCSDTGGPVSVVVRDSIVHGGQFDVSSYTSNCGDDSVLVAIDHSAFRTTSGYTTGTHLTEGAGNQRTAAQNAPSLVFVDEFSGNYHPKDGSTLVDAGASTTTTLDLAGTARNQGAAPDIGAYEFASPVAPVVVPTTPPVVPVTGTTPPPTVVVGVRGASFGALAKAKLAWMKSKLSVDTGIVVTCPKGGPACTGPVAVQLVTKRKVKRKTVVVLVSLGSVKTTLAPGAAKRLTLTFGASAATRLAKLKSATLRITARVQPPGATPTPYVRSVTVKVPPKPRVTAR